MSFDPLDYPTKCALRSRGDNPSYALTPPAPSPAIISPLHTRCVGQRRDLSLIGLPPIDARPDGERIDA